MGGAFRATAIFLATALLIGWPGGAVCAVPLPDYDSDMSYSDYLEVRENAYPSVRGGRYADHVYFAGCCYCKNKSVTPQHRHQAYVVGSQKCDNRISFIILGRDLAIKVFEHNDFQGQSTIFRKSLNLPGTGWNDRISSFIVFCRNQPDVLGIQVYMHYTKTWPGGGGTIYKFIPAPNLLSMYRVRFTNWSYTSNRMIQITRTNLDVAWRACTGQNFTGQCYTVPGGPGDKRFVVPLPLWLRENVRSLEMWLISQAGKFKCTDYGDGIVSCPYAQMQKATLHGVQAKPFWWTTGTVQGHRAPPAPGRPSPPPPRMVTRPPRRPGQVYRPPVRVPGPAGVTAEPNVDRPGLDYRRLAMPGQAPADCRRACLADPRCRAYTYVRPGFQGRRAWCWLKHGVPRPVERRCCVSGVKTGRAGPGPWPGQRPGFQRRCPPGQYWNARARRCLCPPGLWWNTGQRRCVRRVAPGRTPIVHRCPPGLRWNPRVRRCVRRVLRPRSPLVRRCPPGQDWSAGLRRCVCPPGLWWNPRQRRCVRRVVRPRPPVIHRCPPGQQWSPQARRCLRVVR